MGAVKCHGSTRWTEGLPTAFLGIRFAWKEDFGTSVAEMLYGEPLRLSGGFLVPATTPVVDTEPRGFMRMLSELRSMQRSTWTSAVALRRTIRHRRQVREDLRRRRAGTLCRHFTGIRSHEARQDNPEGHLCSV